MFEKYYLDEEAITKRVKERFMWEETELKGKIDEKEDFLSTRSVFKRSRIIYPSANPVIAFFAYLFTGIGRNRKDEISSELVGLYKKQKEAADKRRRLIRQEKVNRVAQQAMLLYYTPLFLKWTDTVYVFEKGWNTAFETHKRTGEKTGG